MGQKHPIVTEVVGISLGGAYDDLLFFPIDPGALLCVQRVTCRDFANACTDVWVGIRRGAGYQWVHGFGVSVATFFQQMVNPIWVPSGYQVVVRFWGATAADPLEAYLYGYILTE